MTLMWEPCVLLDTNSYMSPDNTAEEEELVSYSNTILMLTPQSQIPLKRLNSWMFVTEIVRALEL